MTILSFFFSVYWSAGTTKGRVRPPQITPCGRSMRMSSESQLILMSPVSSKRIPRSPSGHASDSELSQTSMPPNHLSSLAIKFQKSGYLASSEIYIDKARYKRLKWHENIHGADPSNSDNEINAIVLAKEPFIF